MQVQISFFQVVVSSQAPLISQVHKDALDVEGGTDQQGATLGSHQHLLIMLLNPQQHKSNLNYENPSASLCTTPPKLTVSMHRLQFSTLP